MRRLPATAARTVREQRGSIIGFGLAAVAIAVLDIAVYPGYRDTLKSIEIPDAMKVLIGDADYRTAAGFIHTEFFSWVPALLVVFAIIAGTGVIAGEESSGTLDLLLAQPVARRRVLIEKWLGLIVALAVILAAIMVAFVAAVLPVDIEVDLPYVALAVGGTGLLVVAFATIALAATAALPSRRAAITWVSALAVASFVVNNLGLLVGALEPLRPFSLFAYLRTDTLLTGTQDAWRLAVFPGVTLVALVAALLAFERRDIGLGLRGWRREARGGADTRGPAPAGRAREA